MRRHDPIEITIRFVRAAGPVTREQIERELLAQCTYTARRSDARRQAAQAIEHGLGAGWLDKYDEESYCYAAKPGDGRREDGKMSKQTTDSYGMTAEESAANVARIMFAETGDLEAALHAGHAATAGMPHPLDAQVRLALAEIAAGPSHPIFDMPDEA